MRPYLLLAIASTILCTTACKKSSTPTVENPTPTGTSTIFIVNNTGENVNIELSGKDITSGTMPHLLSYLLTNNDTLKLTPDSLKNNYQYTYSWNNTNYTLSNWYVYKNGNPVTYSFAYYRDSSNKTIVIDNNKRNDLLVCFDGNGQSSHWETLDAYDENGSSVWPSLSEQEKAHTFDVYKSYVVRHSFIVSTSKDTSTLQRFELIDTSPSFTLLAEITDKYGLSSSNPDYTSTSFDTLFYRPFQVDSTGATVYQYPYYKIIKTSVSY